MEDYSLSQLVAAYRNKELSYKEIEDRLSIFVYEYPKKIHRWDPDLCSEFFEFFYPRIKLAADRFNDRGIPFENYLGSLVFYQMKTFMIRKREAEEKENMLAVADYHNNSDFYESREGEPVIFHAGEINAPYQGTKRKKKGKKRIFYMAMTDPDRLDEESIEKLADFTGYRAEYIRRCRDALSRRVSEKREKAAAMAERRNSCYFRYLMLEDRLRRESDPEVRDRLERKVGELHYKIERINRKMAGKHIKVTHKDIAEVLEIPKGTVDSSLYYLKRTLE